MASSEMLSMTLSTLSMTLSTVLLGLTTLAFFRLYRTRVGNHRKTILLDLLSLETSLELTASNISLIASLFFLGYANHYSFFLVNFHFLDSVVGKSPVGFFSGLETCKLYKINCRLSTSFH